MRTDDCTVTGIIGTYMLWQHSGQNSVPAKISVSPAVVRHRIENTVHDVYAVRAGNVTSNVVVPYHQPEACQ